jgi:hypothetical protein
MKSVPAFKPWLEQVPAIMFGCLKRGEFRVILHPGAGMLDGGAFFDVPYDSVPFELRMPNTKLWIKLDDDWRVLRVWKRLDDNE